MITRRLWVLRDEHIAFVIYNATAGNTASTPLTWLGSRCQKHFSLIDH